MYCINYAINSGSYCKIAETLLPMTKRKGSGKVWEEHDRKFLVGGGGGKVVWNFWRLSSHPTLKMTWSSNVPVNQGLDDTLNISPEEVTNFYLFWSLSKVVDHTNDWFSLDWIINAMEMWKLLRKDKSIKPVKTIQTSILWYTRTREEIKI